MLVLTLTFIGVFVVVYGELAAKVKDWKDPGCVYPDSMQAQLTVEGGNQERTGTSSEHGIDHLAEEDAVYIKIKKEFYTSLQTCLEEGKTATVTFNCSRVEGLPRNVPFGMSSNGRQREFGAASAPLYQQLPVT
mgnify:CR=1 FL=1